MDSAPPPPIHCETPAQDVLLRVSGAADPREFSAFLKDVEAQDGAWTIDTSQIVDGAQILVLRAKPKVTYRAVEATRFNAAARGFSARITFDEPRCPGPTD